MTDREAARASGWVWVSGSAEVGYHARIESAEDIAYGTLLGYNWTAYRDAEAGVRLQYGCVTLPLAQWYERLDSLCVLHEPDRALTYYEALARLLDLISVSVRSHP